MIRSNNAWRRDWNTIHHIFLLFPVAELILQSITLITFCSPSNLLEFQTNFQCSNGEMENKRLNGFLPSNETNDPSAISIVTIYGDISSTYPVIPLVALPPAKWFPDVNCIFNRIDRWKKTASLTPSFCKVKKDPSLPWKEIRNLSNHSWKIFDRWFMKETIYNQV